MAVESSGDLASLHGSIVPIAGAHSWSYRSDNPICTRTLRQIALDDDTSLQALGVEALQRLLEERQR